MKVIYTYHCCQQAIGGISRYFFEIYRRLSQSIQVEMSSHYMNNLYFSQLIEGKKKDLCERRFLTKYYIRNWIENWYMYKALRCTDADVIHATGESPWVFHCLRDSHRPKVVVTIHDMIPELTNNKRRIGDRKRCIFQSDAIVCVSHWTKKDLLRIYPDVDPHKVFVIYHGFENLPTDQTRGLSEYSALSLSPYLLYVGVREGYKNFDTMLRGIAPLLREKGLTLVCTGHPFNEAEQALIQKLGIGQHLRNVGFVSDALLVQLYQHALAFIFPSKYEGFGIPILESMANGCPLCLSSTSCFPEIAGDAGAYFDPASEASIESCVRRVLDDASYRNQLIEKGRERISHYSWDIAARKTQQVYEWVLQQ